VTKEDEAVVHMRYMGLLHIQRELQFIFKEPTARFAYCLGMFTGALDHDHKVIRIPTVGDSWFPLPVFSHSNRTLLENGEVPRPPIFPHFLVQVVRLHPRIEFMQHDVG
jgi:hypothetical protein